MRRVPSSVSEARTRSSEYLFLVFLEHLLQLHTLTPAWTTANLCRGRSTKLCAQDLLHGLSHLRLEPQCDSSCIRPGPKSKANLPIDTRRHNSPRSGLKDPLETGVEPRVSRRFQGVLAYSPCTARPTTLLTDELMSLYSSPPQLLAMPPSAQSSVARSSPMSSRVAWRMWRRSHSRTSSDRSLGHSATTSS
jgi:hypothetical protein